MRKANVWLVIGGFVAASTMAVLAQGGQGAAQPAADDPVRALVAQLELEKYKATIKGLTAFGDRRQGTKRNRDAVDWIAALENWVEKGRAPDKVIVGHLKQEQTYGGLPRLRFPVDPSRIDRTRPVYPYPALARWSGKGDINDASTWEVAR